MPAKEKLMGQGPCIPKLQVAEVLEAGSITGAGSGAICQYDHGWHNGCSTWQRLPISDG